MHLSFSFRLFAPPAASPRSSLRSPLISRTLLALTFVAGIAAGCGGDEGSAGGAGTCVPGAQTGCACPGGAEGVQVCNADGKSFAACECGGSAGSGAAGGGGIFDDCGNSMLDGAEECDDGNQDNTDGCTTLCKEPFCGDGFVQPGETCDDGGDVDGNCPDNCMDGGGGAGGDPCAGQLTYAGLVADQPSVWMFQGLTSLDAGNAMCAGIGADHFCDYEEVKQAEMKGELALIANGTTAWIHRTTDAMVNAQLSVAGPGGRCNDWLYGTNHISDGEFVSFDSGVPTYSLDNDTIYDGIDTTHTQPGLLECGGVNRAILCCFPKCVP